MIRVIIAEDNELVQEGLRSKLEKEDDIKVEACANNGEEAINLCKKYKPDIILMDIKMPIMNGLEATKKINEFNGNIKVLIMTDLKSESAHIKADYNAYKIAGFVHKTDSKELISNIRSIVCNKKIIFKEEYINDLRKKDTIVHKYSLEKFFNEYKLEERYRKIFSSMTKDVTYINSSISEEVCLGEKTVKTYVSHIYSIIGVKNQPQFLNFWKNYKQKAQIDYMNEDI
jgi:DNA-binding NarL/FixJ family response regulator